MNRFFAAYFGNLTAMLTVAIIFIIIGYARAEAQGVPCAETGVIEKQLTEDYGETLRDEQPAPVPGGIAYLWANGSTGTYTVLIKPQPGLTCMIDTGQSDRLKEQAA